MSGASYTPLSSDGRLPKSPEGSQVEDKLVIHDETADAVDKAGELFIIRKHYNNCKTLAHTDDMYP